MTAAIKVALLRSARIVVLAWMAGVSCFRWTPYAPTSVQSQGRTVNIARLVMRDGTARVLYRLSVIPDSVVGFADRAGRSRVAYPSLDVKEIQRSEFSPGRTTIFVVAIPVVALVGLFIYISLACGECAR